MPWRRALGLAWQTVVYLGLGLLCLIVFAWMTLQWGILPHIEDWRPEVEHHASQAVGVPVHIGHISVRSSGWVPALDLRDVVLDDNNGAEALRLPHVSAALSPRSLLVLAPRLSQLYIEGARLLVRRDVRGHLHVAGLDLAAHTSAASSDESGALDWIFSQEEIVLRHGALHWIDEQRGAPALELSDVDIVVRNGLRSHDLRIDATPPAEWGDRASLQVRAQQSLFSFAGDWRRWTGTLYASLPRGDVAQLKHHVDLPFELDRGVGALRLWLDFQNEHWRSVTADVALRDVNLRFAPELDPLAITRAAGRLSAHRDPAGVALAAEHFGFETASGVVWPVGDLRLAWQQQQPGIAAKDGRRAWVSRHRDELADARTGSVPAPVASAAAPASAARLPWESQAPVTGGQLAADHLDLMLMRRLAGALPLTASARQWLADFQPEGVIQPLAARWEGASEAPRSYRVAASITGFSMAAGAIPAGARNGRPGWRNASVDLDANEAGGTARVTLDKGAIELPGVFEEPVIAFDRLGARASWKIEPARDAAQAPAITLAFDDVRFANADAEGHLRLQWHSGAGAGAPVAPSGSASAAGRGQRFPGLIDLQGELTHGRAARLARYLPLTVGPDTRRYLAAAFRTGEMEAVNFNVRGDLASFPYARNHDGDFRIDGRVSGVDLDYVPGTPAEPGARAPALWPVFTQVAGQIVLDRNTLEIRDASGRMGGLELKGVHGAIRSLYEQPVLGLQGKVAGPMTDFLRYVAQSPVGGWLHHGLAPATASGNASLDLTLAIPLQHADDSRVTGALTLAGNDVRLEPGLPLLAGAHARIDFTERGVTVVGAGARALGGELAFDGGSQPDGSLRFVAQGTASAEGLRRQSEESPELARLAARLSGQAAYRLTTVVARGQTEFTLASSLAGLGLALPAPLNKPAEASWPLNVSTTLAFDEQGRPRDTLRVELGPRLAPLAQAEIVRDRSGGAVRVVRGAYALGGPLPALQPGGVLSLRGAAFDADSWVALARALAGGASAGTAAPASSAEGTAASGYLPAAAVLRTQDLLLGGRHLSNAEIMLARVGSGADEVWRSNVSSDQTKGVVEYRPETSARGAQLFARLDRLALDPRESEGETAAGAQPESGTTSLPALDVVVDDFEVGSKKLGKLEVSATAQAGGRDWRLARLALTTPEARLTGSGHWSGAAPRRVALDFKLDLADSGAYLERLGMGRVLKKGKGSLSGTLSWTGSPLALDYPSLQGKLQLALDAGQFLKADAGAGRLLGVLSLQSLPRRFTLDFRDLFQEGFAFDNVDGDVLIDHGVATTRDLRMRSVTAMVLMAGHADLRAETQDLDVIIVPEINAGAASLAYAAINPAIGIGTFLAQIFLRSPLTEAGTRELHVTGTWAAPKVDQVEHKAAVAAAAQVASQARAAEAAQAASAASAAFAH